MSLSIEIIDSADGFRSLENTWKQFEYIPSGLNFGELMNWWDALGSFENNKIGYNKKLKILVASRDGSPACILPLVEVLRIKKKYSLRVELKK